RQRWRRAHGHRIGQRAGARPSPRWDVRAREPARRAHDPAAARAHPARRRRIGRILLAEDAPLLRDGLVALLERAGHDVVAAVPTATELAAEAASRIPAGTVDLVITDVRMPPDHGDDGLRAALRIRQEHPTMPILVLSQYIEQRYASALLGIAADSEPAR